jgi:BioD-like phosphotransacetylase family protein
MGVLYIAGSQPGAGKTALASALAYGLAARGRTVAVIKPLRASEETGPDADSTFFRQLIPGNPQPDGWPITLTPEQMATSPSVLEGIPELVKSAGAGAETIIVEGLDGVAPESPASRASADLVERLQARVVVVARHTPSTDQDELAGARQTFGGALAGLILNGVPRYQAHDSADPLAASLRSRDVPVLGLIPEDRRMLAPSVGDVATHLDGEFRLLEDRADQLVESFMIGGFFLDSGDYIFSRREQKAVLVRADRPDLQMAALRTSTVCLVLTGGQNPIQYITYHAEQEQVPMILVQRPTVEAMDRLETVADRVTVHHTRKAARFHELLTQHCDLSILAEIGLS